MSKKRGLGKGLGALIPTYEDSEPEMVLETVLAPAGLRIISVNAIQPNPHQPRTQFDETALQELSASIKEHGLIQPLIVNMAEGGRYTLIAGERRWRASQLAGVTQVPVVIKEASTQEMLELALIENIQRADLNALEEANAYQQLIDEFGLTQTEVAKRVGKSRPAVTNMVRLLKLPPDVQKAVLNSQISGGHAKALLGLPTPEAQMAVMRNIIKNSLSVRQTEGIVRKMVEGTVPVAKPVKRLPPELTSLESQFRQSLGTRVNIQMSGKGGKVVIHYYSDEELQTIYDVIVGEEM